MFFKLSIVLLVILALFLWLYNPADKKLQLSQVTGHLPNLEFSLMDDVNRPVTEKKFRNKVVLVYFGYSGCGNECPLTLRRLAGIMRQLGNNLNAVQILFITVDPANDTPEIMHQYLRSFDTPQMLGLSGREQEIKRLAKRYRIAYRGDNSLKISHSNVVYIFDKTGHARLLTLPDDADEKIINDLQVLIGE